MQYHPLTPEDKAAMLETLGVSAFEDLLKEIPAKLRHPKLDVPEALSEMEVQDLLRTIGGRNGHSGSYKSYLGGGSYEHFIPSAVGAILSRNEFYTAYTPYQPEASQGTLQAIYEYQSLITELTGLDLSNASHYDGATSMAEAALLALRHTDRTRILVCDSVHPHYRRVLKTYLEGTPFEVEEFPRGRTEGFDKEAFKQRIHDKVAGAIFQTPNFFGVVEDLEGVADTLHEQGALLITVSYPLALGIFKSPGEWGADVAVGEGQPLGIPLTFGGPYLGYFATTRALMRRMPGRLAGMTHDAEGRRAFCLTLQAREQHIRRERAASNICTNQALCALAACVYMTLLGKEGIREIGEINLDRATYLREKIAGLKGYTVDLKQTIFNEFVVRADRDFETIQDRMMKRNIFPGLDLAQFYPEEKNAFLVCVTETKSKGDLDDYIDALKGVK